MAPSLLTELVPRTYEGSAPPTGSKCEEPTPHDQYEILLASINAKSEEEKLSAEPLPTSSSFQDKVMGAVTQGVKKFTSTIGQTNLIAQSQMRDLQEKLSSQIFKISFPSLAASGEKFLASFPCSTIHNDKVVSGSLIITQNYVCFSSSSTSMVFNSAKEKVQQHFDSLSIPPSEVIGSMVPLASIVSIVPSIALQTRGDTPHFMDIPEVQPEVLPTSLQLYTGDGLVYQFFDFESFSSKVEGVMYSQVKGTPVELAYNYVDHAWRCVLSA